MKELCAAIWWEAFYQKRIDLGPPYVTRQRYYQVIQESDQDAAERAQHLLEEQHAVDCLRIRRAGLLRKVTAREPGPVGSLTVLEQLECGHIHVVDIAIARGTPREPERRRCLACIAVKREEIE